MAKQSKSKSDKASVRGPGMGNYALYESMVLRRRSGVTTPQVHGQRRIKTRAASKSFSINHGY